MMKMLKDTASFYGCFFYFLRGNPPNPCPYFRVLPSDSASEVLFKKHARIHLYNLAAAFFLYSHPHYRKGSYKEDIVDNFRNVAIPGTGIPLSIFVGNKIVALWFVLVVYPVISLVAAVHLTYGNTKASLERKVSLSEEYCIRLLAPDDWFSYWRLNCRVAGLHALLNDVPSGYDMENKWTFLKEGFERGVPVSPFLSTPGLVVKHRNEEGGMGIFFYKNATAGGDWILQERIENSDWVSGLLPPNAPLSTFRVITQSRASLDLKTTAQAGDVTALSCVFRAGRAGAATDHDSILFDVDVGSGEIKGGTTNAHWYRLGLMEVLRCPWRSTHDYTHHPDGNIPVTGKVIPDMKAMLKLVEDSHLKLCPDVPFVGWDVVLSKDHKLPVCLLEVNLSCNFFRGSFDKKVYLDFIDDAITKLHHIRLTKDTKKHH